MTTYTAAISMSLAEYRLWWYSEAGVRIPEQGERLTVSQENDERLIREGYNYARKLQRREQSELAKALNMPEATVALLTASRTSKTRKGMR